MRDFDTTQYKKYALLERQVGIFLPGIEKTLRVVLAVALASHFDYPAMLWLLLVDVPSSGKTDLVKLIKNAKDTYFLDNLTTNAFVSGERITKTNKVHDLLPELNNKCLIIKDWTSIFSLDEKATRKIIGDLVNIYDKEYVKFSSARGMISYRSYFSHLGCITPATLNKHTQYLNMVGARFLFLKLPEVSEADDQISLKRIFSGEDRGSMEKQVGELVCQYFDELLTKIKRLDHISEAAMDYLHIGAKLISHCRGIINIQPVKYTTEDGKEAINYEVIDWQVEKYWRALHQLKTLAECLALVVGHNEIGLDEFEIIKDVVLSSMPADRSQAIRIIEKSNGILTAKQLSDSFGKSWKTSKRLLEELFALQVVDKLPGSGSMAADYIICSEFKDFICKPPTEFLSTYSRQTEIPLNIEQNNQPSTDNQQEEVINLSNEELMEREANAHQMYINQKDNPKESKKLYYTWFVLHEELGKRGL